MFRFMYPNSFHAFWFLLFIAILFVLYRQQVKQKLKKVFGQKMLPFFLQGVSSKKISIKFILYFLCASLMIFAMARPQMGKGETTIKNEGVEVMVVVDVSNSMLAEDVKPSRLIHARKEVFRLLDTMGGHKVGLLAFAGSAVLLSPLTSDKSALKMFLETLSPESVESQGTELKKALLEAQDSFERGGVEEGPDQRVTRVIVLISDGEDHDEGAAAVAAEIAKKGTRVFTMAFGSERGGKIPKRDGRGVLKGYFKDDANKEVVSKVNGEALKKIATAGKGSFYHVTFGGDHMKRLLEDLNKLEKSEFDSLSSESFSEKYQLPLLIALLLGLLELFLGTRRRQKSQWKGRFLPGGPA